MRFFLVILLSLCASLQPVQAKEELLEGIVAVVNDEVILNSELDARINIVVNHLEHQYQPVPPIAYLQNELLDQLITEHVIQQRAEQVGIGISEEMLTRTVETMARQNNLSMEALTASILAEGQTMESFRAGVRQDALKARLKQREIASRINVTSSEVDQFIKTVDGQEKLGIKYDVVDIWTPEEGEKGRKAAQTLAKKLTKASDLRKAEKELAAAELGFQRSAMGVRGLSALPQRFASAIVGAKVPGVLAPIETGNGWHVLVLLDRSVDGAPDEVELTRVRHILVQAGEQRSAAQAKARAWQLYSDLKHGAKFEEVAKAHSDDTASAAQGGDIGWSRKGELAPAFAEAMQGLTINTLSEPVETAFGWHIIKVVDRKTETDQDAVIRNRAQDLLYRQKFEDEGNAWLQQLREEAFVEKRLSRQ